MSQNGVNFIINGIILIKNLVLENFALLYIVRSIYVRVIQKQERKNFSVPIAWSYKDWGISMLYKWIT